MKWTLFSWPNLLLAALSWVLLIALVKVVILALS